MKICRATYTDKNKVLHTHVVLTSSQLAKIVKQARQKGCAVRVEKLDFHRAYVSKQA